MATGSVTVRALAEADVAAADRVTRLAFGSHFGAPEPERFFGDAEPVRSRATAAHVAGWVAEQDGRVVGSAFLTRWGSMAVVGPVTVAPDRWDAGIGGRLMAALTGRLDDWGVALAGLFTFADSTKHVGLYHRFGFYPRALTALASREVAAAGPVAEPPLLAAAPDSRRAGGLAAVREVAASIYPGLDLTDEIDTLAARSLGEVVLLPAGADPAAARLDGFAVCHLGAGSEAGSGTCYVKFGCVRPGPGADLRFAALLAACEALAAARGLREVLAGVNTARAAAYDALLARGYRAGMYGVAMHRPNLAGFSRPEDWVLDDWR